MRSVNLVLPFTECADSVQQDPLTELDWALSEPPQALLDLRLQPKGPGAPHSAAEEEEEEEEVWCARALAWGLGGFGGDRLGAAASLGRSVVGFAPVSDSPC